MRILITGAAGSLGQAAMAGLADRGHRVVGLDLLPPPEGYDGPWHTVDCADPDAVADVVGVASPQGIVHLAGVPDETNLPDALHSHVVTTGALLDAMVEHDVGRIVYASSNHAVGRTPRFDQSLGEDAVPRPDTFYGVAKVAAEALLRLYADRHGLDVVTVRIGSFLAQPETTRHLATWLSPDDWVRLAEAALTCPAPGYAVVYGISRNTRAWWDLEPGRRIGYHPLDDAEEFAASVPARDADRFESTYAGGPFVAERFHRPALDRG